MAHQTLITIEHLDGRRQGVVATPRGYLSTNPNGTAHRISVSAVRNRLDEFDDLCNEGQARLVEIDDNTVAELRR